MLPHKQSVIIICGPTAVGKTAVAVKLAKQLQTEIISADSRQCYKELNIGVAKPSPEELTAVHHHFINSHSIHEDVNAALFEDYALNAAKKVFSKSDVAVMVGGTGLYIKAFTDGLDSIPVTPDQIRNDISQNYELKGLDWLQSEVQKKDLAFWKTAEQKNPHRLIRALEVVTATGKSINDFKKGDKIIRPFNIIKIGLGLPKNELNENINLRVDRMIEVGLVEEVKNLLPFQNLKALQTVGYKEIFQYLNKEITLDKAITEIKTNTRQYAKRQLTWFKKDVEINWLQVSNNIDNNVLSLVKEKLQIK
jgi:tRNA dimethylallyltransferase